MSKYVFRLNPIKPQNYSFFCPDSGLHLSLLMPQREIELDELTPSILRGIKSKTLEYLEGDTLECCTQCGYTGKDIAKELEPTPDVVESNSSVPSVSDAEPSLSEPEEEEEEEEEDDADLGDVKKSAPKKRARKSKA